MVLFFFTELFFAIKRRKINSNNNNCYPMNLKWWKTYRVLTIRKEPFFFLMLLLSALPGFMSCIELWDCTFMLLGFPQNFHVCFSLKTVNLHAVSHDETCIIISMSRYIAFHLAIYVMSSFSVIRSLQNQIMEDSYTLLLRT